jgi:hypothetical protein
MIVANRMSMIIDVEEKRGGIYPSLLFIFFFIILSLDTCRCRDCGVRVVERVAQNCARKVDGSIISST